MAQSGLDICSKCSAPTWCDYGPNGAPRCKACKIVGFFEFLYEPLGFHLLNWQRDDLRNIYGNVDAETGLRRYKEAYSSMAKKNGKSFLVGGLPIYHLCCENEFNPTAYGAAAAKDQAGIVFRAAAQLVNANSELKRILRVLDSTKRIVRRDGNGFYAVLSADGDIQDGIEPSLAIIDELHRWKTKKAETLHDVITRGTISRREPLVVKITTAGETHESPLWKREHTYAQQILSGSLKSDRYYARIWAADSERLKNDPEFWKSREARVQANPSHEDLGGFLKDEAIREQMDKAVASPEEYRKYLRYHLNVEAEAETRYISASDWNKCAVKLRPLVDRECYAGVDLGATSDMCALVLVFPDSDGTYDVLPFFWVPDERVDELARKTKASYHRWIREELLMPVDGFAVTEDHVIEKLEWAMQMFAVKEICYDPWHAAAMAQKLIDRHGATMVKIPQNFSLLSEPTKKVRDLCADGKLRHEGNPILAWHADCATVRADGKDNVMLTKPDRNTSPKRIDGMAAMVNAFVRALVASEQPRPLFMTEGLSFI